MVYLSVANEKTGPPKTESPVKVWLAFFPEEAETQRGGGLILPLFPQGNDDEHRQRYHIGEHLVKLLDGQVGAGGNVEIQDVKPTEQWKPAR